jgi:hypothetical protein
MEIVAMSTKTIGRSVFFIERMFLKTGKSIFFQATIGMNNNCMYQTCIFEGSFYPYKWKYTGQITSFFLLCSCLHPVNQSILKMMDGLCSNTTNQQELPPWIRHLPETRQTSGL